ncbi:MAG: hypothetical protein NXI15_10745 [Gammaproteobacteria bacterium]|nr:hypothetical protein [Gammaproteobacteria bacterium]
MSENDPKGVGHVYMQRSVIFRIAVFVTVAILVAALFWLTLDEPDSSAGPQLDISGAVLAEQASDQDALVNRALLL